MASGSLDEIIQWLASLGFVIYVIFRALSKTKAPTRVPAEIKIPAPTGNPPVPSQEDDWQEDERDEDEDENEDEKEDEDEATGDEIDTEKDDALAPEDSVVPVSQTASSESEETRPALSAISAIPEGTLQPGSESQAFSRRFFQNQEDLRQAIITKVILDKPKGFE